MNDSHRAHDPWRSPPAGTQGSPFRSSRTRVHRGLRSTVSGIAQWSVGGLLLLISVLLFPVGLLLLPVAAAFVIFLFARRLSWPDPLGSLLGAAAVCGYVAYRNRDHVPCDATDAGVIAQSSDAFACGGTAPAGWLGVAVALVVAATAGLALTALADRRAR